MGSAGHLALDHLKQGWPLDRAIAAVRGFYRECPPDADPYEWDIERETVECLVVGWEWRWTADPLHTIESELEFNLPVYNPDTEAPTPNWTVAGKTDGVVKRGNRTLVIEHKFVSDSLEPGNPTWLRLQMDPQVTLYYWAMRELGHSPDGVIYDLIRKPTIKPDRIPILDEDGAKIVLDGAGERVFTKQGKPRQTGDNSLGYELQYRMQTPQEYGMKLLDDIYTRPDWYYSRLDISCSDRDVTDMQAEIWDIQLAMRDTQRKGAWYRSVSRDTCPYCPYMQLCLYRWEPNGSELPEGFVKAGRLHEELSPFNEGE
jgi:hypothetical protein